MGRQKVTEPIRATVPAQLPAEDDAVPPVGSSDAVLIAALVAALIAGAAIERLGRILGRFTGLTAALATTILSAQPWGALLEDTAIRVSQLPREETPPVLVLHQGATVNAFRRATYLVNGTRRLAPAYASGDLGRIHRAQEAERRYYLAFQDAERSRDEAVFRVAEVAARYGIDRNGELLLGWKSIIDSRTSNDCYWANGRNFNALRMPSIGYPGMVHGPSCRCRPVKPYNTRKRVEVGTPPKHEG